LLREDKIYATLFDKNNNVSQSHKGQIIEEIIEKLEEKMKKRSEDE
jgi:hypothetical protein